MPFTATKIEDFPGLLVIEPKVFGDERGFFFEPYSARDFAVFGVNDNFIQDNHSRSTKGILRGLHFQNPPYAQVKLVRCIRGEIFDVVVDICKGSPSYGKYFSIVLSEENKKMLYVPKGFAHGILVTSEIAEVCYKVDVFYTPKSEGGIIWNDSELNINWPQAYPKLNERDKNWPKLAELQSPFTFEG